MKSQRRRWTAADAERVLAAFEESGLSLAEFCRRQGVHPERVRRWRKRLETASPLPVPRLVELVPTRPSVGVRLRVVFPTGVHVEVSEVSLDEGLATTLSAVASLPLNASTNTAEEPC